MNGTLKHQCECLVVELEDLGVELSIRNDDGKEQWTFAMPKKAKRACRAQFSILALFLNHGLGVSDYGVEITPGPARHTADEIEAALCQAIREARRC